MRVIWRSVSDRAVWWNWLTREANCWITGGCVLGRSVARQSMTLEGRTDGRTLISEPAVLHGSIALAHSSSHRPTDAGLNLAAVPPRSGPARRLACVICVSQLPMRATGQPCSAVPCRRPVLLLLLLLLLRRSMTSRIAPPLSRSNCCRGNDGL